MSNPPTKQFDAGFCVECRWEAFRQAAQNPLLSSTCSAVSCGDEDATHIFHFESSRCCDADNCPEMCESVCDGYVDCDASSACSEACAELECQDPSPACFDEYCVGNMDALAEMQPIPLGFDQPALDFDSDPLTAYLRSINDQDARFPSGSSHLQSQTGHQHVHSFDRAPPVPPSSFPRRNPIGLAPTTPNPTCLPNPNAFNTDPSLDTFLSFRSHPGMSLFPEGSENPMSMMPMHVNPSPSCAARSQPCVGSPYASVECGVSVGVPHAHTHSRLSTASAFTSPPLKAEESPTMTSPEPSGELSGIDSGNMDRVHVCHCIIGGGKVICGVTLPTAGKLQEHLLHAHVAALDGPDGHGFYCTWRGCARSGRPFSQKSKLQGHFLSHSNHKGFKCNVCGKSFGRQATLERHARSHSGVKPYVCDVCGKRFTDGSELKTHMRTHTGEKPFKCNYPGCSFETGDSSNMSSHRLTHRERRHKCPISSCLKGFTRPDQLKRHLRATHKVEPGSPLLSSPMQSPSPLEMRPFSPA